MKKNYFFIALIAMIMTSCAKDANEVLESVYNSLKTGDYVTIAENLYLGKEASLSKEEKEQFASLMQSHSATVVNPLNNFAIQKCSFNQSNDTASYIVKTIYADDNFEEKGIMIKDEKGNWKIVVDEYASYGPTENNDSLSQEDNIDEGSDISVIQNNCRLIPITRFCLLNILATRGNAKAQLEVAKCYLNSENVELSLHMDKGINYLKKAAKQGLTEAEYMLGEMYWTGVEDLIDQNVKKAIELFEKTANKGNAHAMYKLGLAYGNGNGVAVDKQKARNYYRMAAEKGDVNAQIQYGYILETEDFNMKEALKWYQKSADQGNMIAQYNLGQMYRSGNGVEVDYEKALKYYKKAADQGYADAMNCLGFMYEKGLGVNSNINTAYQWYQAAADAGNVYGTNNANRLTRGR